MKIIERARGFARKTKAAMTPSSTAWKGAGTGVYVLGTLVATLLFTSYFLQDFTWQKMPGYIVSISTLMLIGVGVMLVAFLLMAIPASYRTALALFAPLVLIVLFPGGPPNNIVAGLVLILLASVVGAGIAVIRRDGLNPPAQKITIVVLVLGFVGLFVGLYAIFSEKEAANPLLDKYVLENRTLDLPNPGLPGNLEVLTLTYGSGKNQPRDMFGQYADLISRTVDGSKLIDNWDGFSGWLRTSYWGFDETELPLQARVWYPDGDGPFPLVLVVHGNHSMEDFSDPGYAYLGELLASRGIILASVDENFVNSSISSVVEVFAERPGLEEENDARGWLLLQHLAQWRDWNAQVGHRFHDKVDMDRVALIGHSRGGEAVGIAAAFNTLERYPDDATLDFDFDFNLRGVIAIAPVYGQYQPRERYTPVRDVNYFTIHGDMDGDVQSFEGMAQYSHVSFSGNSFRFRSGLYVVGANHGQFNTTWENKDTGLFGAWALDLGGIMDAEAQRDVARVYFSAFLEVVLNGRDEYLPVFRDARYAAAWLPKTFYINQFSSSTEVTIVDFEEDIDPATTTITDGHIATQYLSKWFEVGNELKYDELDTHSAVYAWDEKFSDETARVDFLFPAERLNTDSGMRLVASISASGSGTMPDDWEEEESATEETEETDNDEEQEDEPLDWTIVLTDAAGVSASLPLSHDSVLYPQIKAVPTRAGFLDSTEPTEVLFRRFEFPLDDFAEANSQIDLTTLTRVSFIFDRSTKGAIIVDDLSIANAE
jgi:pimeloyl-ACP methyl ester carboxylesterase